MWQDRVSLTENERPTFSQAGRPRMDARESVHRISQRGADIEQRRGVAFGARPLGREAKQAPSDQQKRQSSAKLLPSVTLPERRRDLLNRQRSTPSDGGRRSAQQNGGGSRLGQRPTPSYPSGRTLSSGSHRHTKGHDPMKGIGGLGRISLA